MSFLFDLGLVRMTLILKLDLDIMSERICILKIKFLAVVIQK